MAPFPNDTFQPPGHASSAPPLAGVLHIRQSLLQTSQPIEHPNQQGRDARLFPEVRLELFTLGELLGAVQRGQVVPETAGSHTHHSYWHVIPGIGRVWLARTDGWACASFP